jgi:hypothetical protein
MKIVGVSAGVFTVIAGCLSNFVLILLCRLVCGFGVGLACIACPLYVSEEASERVKRPIAGAFQLSVTIGILLTFLLGFLLSESSSAVSLRVVWRIIYISNVIYPLLLLIMGFVVPVSRALSSNNNNNDDSQPIAASPSDPLLTTPNANTTTPPDDQIAPNNGGGGLGWSGLVDRRHRAELGVGLLMGVMLALTGINAVFFYAPSIFAQVGFGAQQSLLSLLLSAWNVLVTIGGVVAVAFVPERSLLLFGLAFNMLGLGIEAVAIQLDARWFAFVGIFVTVFGFAIGPGVVFWVALTRIFGKPVRAAGCSLVNLQQWTENLLLTLLFPVLVDQFGIVVMFWFFFAIGIGCFFSLMFFMKLHNE